MPNAKTLRDLMRIRAANRDFFDSINGTQGTAIGYKKRTSDDEVSNEPAVIVFVPQKINPKWLPQSQVLPKEIQGPNGLSCALDVVEGSSAKDESPVARDESKLAIRLRGWDEQIWAGSQVSHWVDLVKGSYSMGTIGALVRGRTTGELGLLTNQHVAISAGKKLYHPVPWGTHIATTRRLRTFVPDEVWYGPLVDEPDTLVRIDCAFAAFTSHVGEKDLNPHLMGVGEMGEVADIDLDDESMSIIGQDVLRVGRTTGLRSGRVVAFGYEYHDDQGDTRYTDLLVIGTERGENGRTLPFSTHGDSGSLIVTDDDAHRPVGLLWGGWEERRRAEHGQENWTWGACLSRVLDALNIDLVRSF